MLFIHPYKTEFLLSEKRWQSKNWKTLYSKTITDKLDILKETVFIQWKSNRKNIWYCFLLIPDASNAKEYYLPWLKKIKN